jgi:phosphorylcholine metabolism protein LicD
MDLGIDRLLNIFNENNIIYWLDSGTLLGIERDGKLISGDKDIDISVLGNSRVLPLILKLKNVSIKVKKYQGKVVKIKIYGLNERVIDISFFIDTGKNFYSSPQFNINSNHFLLKISFIKKILTSYLYRVKSLDYNILILFKVVRIGYWLIPKDLICVDQLQKQKNNKYNLPFKVNEYLTYRYGDWSKKISNWSSTKDDKGLYFF